MTATPAPLLRRLAREAGGRLFGADPVGYHDARLDYPAELYEAIAEQPGATGGRVLEIGPGTGLATRDILSRLDPAQLVAIEADQALAAALPKAVPDRRVSVLACGFDEAVLAGPFDLACCAAAFHWLDPKTSFNRLRAVLQPGATLALWWNVYRQAGVGDRFADAVTPLIADLDLPPSEGATGHYSLDVAHHRTAFESAGFTGFTPHLFRRERTLDPGQMRALYASYSYVRALNAEARDALLERIEALARDRFGCLVPNLVLTPLYMAQASA